MPEHFWRLASATGYEDLGSGVPRPTTYHEFGWDFVNNQFVIVDVGVASAERMPVSATLAASFLSRCLGLRFQADFLMRNPERNRFRMICSGQDTLAISVWAGEKSRLSLEATQGGAVGKLSLPDGLRRSLGERMQIVTASALHRGLRGELEPKHPR